MDSAVNGIVLRRRSAESTRLSEGAHPQAGERAIQALAQDSRLLTSERPYRCLAPARSDFPPVSVPLLRAMLAHPADASVKSYEPHWRGHNTLS